MECNLSSQFFPRKKRGDIFLQWVPRSYSLRSSIYGSCAVDGHVCTFQCPGICSDRRGVLNEWPGHVAPIAVVNSTAFFPLIENVDRECWTDTSSCDWRIANETFVW